MTESSHLNTSRFARVPRPTYEREQRELYDVRRIDVVEARRTRRGRLVKDLTATAAAAGRGGGTRPHTERDTRSARDRLCLRKWAATMQTRFQGTLKGTLPIDQVALNKLAAYKHGKR